MKRLCKQCNEELKCPNWRKEQIFCSRICWKASEKPNSKITKECEQCSKQFKITPARINTASYCSYKCKGMAMVGGLGYWFGKNRAHMVGSKNPSWKGGITKYPEYRTTMHKRYTAMKIENGGSHTNDEWSSLKLKNNFSCLSCLRKEPEIKLTKDHILPVALGGTDDIKNIQPLCQSCNSWKNKKHINFIAPCLSPIL